MREGWRAQVGPQPGVPATHCVCRTRVQWGAGEGASLALSGSQLQKEGHSCGRGLSLPLSASRGRETWAKSELGWWVAACFPRESHTLTVSKKVHVGFFREIKNTLFTFTDHFINLDILSMLPICHYWLLVGRGQGAANHLPVREAARSKELFGQMSTVPRNFTNHF